MITLNFKKADYCLTPCKRIQGSLGILIPRRVFQISGIGFLILDSNLYWDPDSLRRILDSKDQDSGFHQKITDPGSGLPYWGELLDEVEKLTHTESKNKNNGMLTTFLRQNNFRVLHQ